MSTARAKATLAATAAVALAGLAPAAAQADIGFADVNDGAGPAAEAPAFPGTKAAWAGVCDAADAGTEAGGVGAANGGIEPPAIRFGCIDPGEIQPQIGSSSPEFSAGIWKPGSEPRWRLDPVTGAGTHPDGTAGFWLRKKPVEDVVEVDEHVRDVIVRLPPGVVGSPAAVPQCPAAASQLIPPDCPASSQVGVSYLNLLGGLSVKNLIYPVYNSEARDTVTAEFTIASVVNWFNVPIAAQSRTNGNFGVDALALKIPTYGPLYGQAFTFWGVPWAADHDRYRVDGGQIENEVVDGGGLPLTGVAIDRRKTYQPGWGPIKPFFSNPTRCQQSPLQVEFLIDSWEKSGRLLADGSPDRSDPRWKWIQIDQDPLEECEKLEFDPSISLRPTVSVADTPAGLDVTLETPQNNDLPFDPPEEGDAKSVVDAYVEEATSFWKSNAGLATAHLKDTVVELPRGTSFNPAAADGIQGCTTGQIGLTSASPQVLFDKQPNHCPEQAKIGTLRVDTPLLANPLEGAVYVAKQNDNPFPGSLTAIYLVVEDEERGLIAKLAGRVDLDPETGQISTTFVDNPQLPFDRFVLHFEDGPRAPLATPPVCGQFKNGATLTPWSAPQSGPPALIEDPFPIAQMPNGFGCVGEPQDRHFAPGFEAGTTSTVAGGTTGFALNLTRRDGEQELSALSLRLAPGVLADLSEVSRCAEGTIATIGARSGLAESTTPACPPASRLGSVDALAGAGAAPLHSGGSLYLAGPYDPDGTGPQPRAPLSILGVVPAIAGGVPGNPAFDLGNVVVRSAAYVDRSTAQVSVAPTQIPYIIDGVPLRVRRVSVAIDRPGFMLNPTNCSELRIDGAIGGAADPLNPGDDVLAAVGNRFQVGNCAALAFEPRLNLRLSGPTRRGGHPRFRAVLAPRAGDANISRLAVTLPRSEFLDQAHIRTICTRVQFAAHQCPEGSIYGWVVAHTPLLDESLSGPVYLRSSDNNLPDLVATLNGPPDLPIEIEAVGRIDSIRGGIRNTFDIVPDAPISKVVLTMQGGKKGLLVNSRNVCAHTFRATVKAAAHNGRRHDFRPVLRNGRCRKQRRVAKRGAHRVERRDAGSRVGGEG